SASILLAKLSQRIEGHQAQIQASRLRHTRAPWARRLRIVPASSFVIRHSSFTPSPVLTFSGYSD
ncbi:MAG: hypothetical protein ABL974_17710, partial [Prosthecobacter sp.]